MVKAKVIKINDKDVVKKAVSILKKGGLIIYPTETSYGIGADATNDETVKKVFDAKHRPFERNIIIAFADIEMVKEFIKISDEAEKLLRKFSPGPLTIFENGVAFRIPKNDVVLRIIKGFGKPVTTTSANISGLEEPYNIHKIIETFSDVVELIIDGGDLKPVPPSTIFDIETKKVLRQGPVTREEIMKALK